MTKITVQPELQSQLQGLRTTAELCDASGRVLGVFVPGQPRLSDIFDLPEVSQEEFERRGREGRYFTTEEAIALLERGDLE